MLTYHTGPSPFCYSRSVYSSRNQAHHVAKGLCRSVHRLSVFKAAQAVALPSQPSRRDAQHRKGPSRAEHSRPQAAALEGHFTKRNKSGMNSRVQTPHARGANVMKSEDFSDGDCDVFVDPDGEVIPVMCADYGFRSGFGRLNQGGDGEIPKNILGLGLDNYRKEFKQLRRSFRTNEYAALREANPPSNALQRIFSSVSEQFVSGMAALDRRLEKIGLLSKLDERSLPDEVLDDDGEPVQDYKEVRAELKKLKLDNAAVWDREHKRENTPGWVAHEAPWPIRGAYLAICVIMDVIYDKRPIQRFWFLEVVARMPYFAYISMLHLYESLGWWRAGAELRKVHFAEEWNEIHHLMIMESLGGDQLWIDRFMAQHAAVFYYWVLVAFFAVSPSLAYVFSEMVEGHAVDTYTQFVEENAEVLKGLPPPMIALQYYKGEDLYYFDALQTAGEMQERRRPSCNNLLDVFNNIKDDEGEHVKTMTACRDYSIVDDLAARKAARHRPGTRESSPKFTADGTRLS